MNRHICHVTSRCFSKHSSESRIMFQPIGNKWRAMTGTTWTSSLSERENGLSEINSRVSSFLHSLWFVWGFLALFISYHEIGSRSKSSGISAFLIRASHWLNGPSLTANFRLGNKRGEKQWSRLFEYAKINPWEQVGAGWICYICLSAIYKY